MFSFIYEISLVLYRSKAVYPKVTSTDESFYFYAKRVSCRHAM